MRNRLLILALLTLAALPLCGQNRSFELIPRATWLDSTGDIDLDEEDENFGIEFDSETGYGLALNFYVTDRLSLEVGAAVIEPDFVIAFADSDGSGGATDGLELIPVTAALQFHLGGGGAFDPYVGVGGAYILFDDLDDFSDLTDDDVEAIELDDEIGLMFNAGLNIGLGQSLALNLDAKYAMIEPDFVVTFDRGDFTETQEAEFNPLIVSAGLSFRF